MSNLSNQCPKCNNYIFGNYCFTCQIDIRNYIINKNNDLPDIFKNIFGDVNRLGDKDERN